MAKPVKSDPEVDVYRTTDKHNRFTEDNKEILNPTPMQPPLNYKPGLSLTEQIRQQVRQAKHLDDMEPETEEEADDFEIDEDPAPPSRWENDMIPSIKEIKKRGEELQRLFARAPQAAEPPAPEAQSAKPEPSSETPSK